jgi:8-oxo-dGTP diphosphatase
VPEIKDSGELRDPEQAWFWTPEWQAREREADAEIAAGQIEVFETAEEFLNALDEGLPIREEPMNDADLPLKYQYAWPRPGLGVDNVIIVGSKILLIKRGHDPFEGFWALPGGFVNENETVEAAAARELAEESNCTFSETPELIGVFSGPGRDPRGWMISVSFGVQLAHLEVSTLRAGDDANGVGLFDLDQLPPLAFDHAQIVATARAKFGI